MNNLPQHRSSRRLAFEELLMLSLRTLKLALSALLLTAFAMPALAQNRPNRDETIKYINNVIGKSVPVVLTETRHGPMQTTHHGLSYDASSKSYRTALVERLEARVDGYNLRVDATTSRSGWNFRNMKALEDVAALVVGSNGERTNTEVRRVRVSFHTASVRNKVSQDISHNGRVAKSETINESSIDFVTFYYRSADPDDAKRLRNALLRLKELDDEEKDPFLN
jgi:hypothetical protein